MRFALGAAGADWQDVFVKTHGEMVELIAAGALKFEQLPLLEMADGTTIVQTGAIVRYIGRTYGMYGASNMEAMLVDQLLEGINDFGGARAHCR